MQEGLSTYVEPIVRARAGATTEAEVWRRWTGSMVHGRPGPGDRGLDETHTWGRTYWGGTLFWFVADVRLREATDNARSLRDVLVHIAATGGNGRADWSTAQVAMWAALGVVREGDSVRFDDRAPRAALRRAITRA
jgi:predicted metalloprotease with PDZ domain